MYVKFLLFFLLQMFIVFYKFELFIDRQFDEWVKTVRILVIRYLRCVCCILLIFLVFLYVFIDVLAKFNRSAYRILFYDTNLYYLSKFKQIKKNPRSFVVSARAISGGLYVNEQQIGSHNQAI